MRFLILISSLFLFVACHNKSDLKKIEELEKENKEMKEKLSPKSINRIYESAKKSILDSIVFGKINSETMLCGFGFYSFRNITESRSLKISQKYTTKIMMHGNQEKYFDSLYYSTPSKNKNNNEKFHHLATDFSFIPNDTGTYYWKGKILIINPRTGMHTEYPIIDSFYVYK